MLNKTHRNIIITTWDNVCKAICTVTDKQIIIFTGGSAIKCNNLLSAEVLADGLYMA
jgi:hypothetical protein